MNDRQRRRHERAIRVRDFAAEHSDLIPAGKAVQAVTRIGQLVAQVETLGATHATSDRTARAGAAGKNVARTELRAMLSAIARTARTISLDEPTLPDTFRLPTANPNNQTLLDTARSFLAAATPLKPRFVEYNLSDNFLTALQAKIGEFEESASRQTVGTSARAANSAAIDVALAEGDEQIARLDAVLRNKFAADPATLTAWESARRLERAPQKRKDEPTPPPPST